MGNQIHCYTRLRQYWNTIWNQSPCYTRLRQYWDTVGNQDPCICQAAPILGHSREPGSLFMPGCANIGTQSGTRILVYARLRQYWDTVGNQEPCLYQAAPILGHSWYPINQANPNAPAPTQYWSNVGTDWQCYLGTFQILFVYKNGAAPCLYVWYKFKKQIMILHLHYRVDNSISWFIVIEIFLLKG